MTGPEHYKEAQRLAAAASNPEMVFDARQQHAAAAMSQAHATLAQIALAVDVADARVSDGWTDWTPWTTVTR